MGWKVELERWVGNINLKDELERWVKKRGWKDE